MQCCGRPFSVGDDVEWTVIVMHRKYPKLNIFIDFEEKYHCSEQIRNKRHVENIYAEPSKKHVDGTTQNYNEVKTSLYPVSYADGWTYPHGYILWGHIVKLSGLSTESTSDGQ